MTGLAACAVALTVTVVTAVAVPLLASRNPRWRQR